MIRALKRWWRYLGASTRRRADQFADPEVQLEQAIEEAQRQHRLLTEQAAAVLANQHQVQLQLGRQIEEVARLKTSAGQALRLADGARRAGDAGKAAQYEDTARLFGTNLASGEASMDNLKQLHDKALNAADAAKRAVQQNRFLLEQRMAERSKLLTQLQQAKLQERMNAAMDTMTGSAMLPGGDVPTLDEVRAKIETRYASAAGHAELGSSTIDARMLEVEKSVLDQRGDDRLAEIRASLGLAAPGDTSVEVLPPRALGEATTPGSNPAATPAGGEPPPKSTT